MVSHKNCGVPDVIIIGAQKAGTTSLFYYLSQHPMILNRRISEVHFFDQHMEKGLSWYFSQFKTRPKSREVRLVEKTPRYLLEYGVPMTLYAVLPNIKLIVILRSPPERAFSAFLMNKYRKVRNRRLTTFEEEVQAQMLRLERGCGLPALLFNSTFSHSQLQQHQAFNQDAWRQCAESKTTLLAKMIARGLYVYQLQRWLQFFPRQQVLILESGLFFSNVEQAMRDVQRFVQVEDYPFPAGLFQKKLNTNLKVNGAPLKASTLETLRSYYRPHNEKLFQLLGKSFAWG